MSDTDLPIERILTLAGDEAFLAEVGRLYARLDERIAARSPVCANRGACCRFGTFGHHLFVTPVELAYFLAFAAGDPSRGIKSARTEVRGSPAACPYQQAGLCTARQGRPAGCRIFFCETKSQPWQPDETESTLRQIKALHLRFDLPYRYLEWLSGLRCLADAGGTAGRKTPTGPIDDPARPPYNPPRRGTGPTVDSTTRDSQLEGCVHETCDGSNPGGGPGRRPAVHGVQRGSNGGGSGPRQEGLPVLPEPGAHPDPIGG